ncbi:MAG: hypothetical protein MZV63_57410 [Marinilabiliales bacterium]|nr:hypothetical protein [Marinilabiliales bacterium]
MGITADESETYSSIREFMVPEYWQPVVLNDYYGKYIKSAVYTKSGAGEKSVIWKGVIESAGYYDVYASIPKSANRMGMARQISMQKRRRWRERNGHHHPGQSGGRTCGGGPEPVRLREPR